MNWIKSIKKRTIISWFIIIAALIIGRFFAFWVVYPLVLSVLIFYSIRFYSTKNIFLYPALTLGTLLFVIAAGEAYIMLSTGARSKLFFSVKSSEVKSTESFEKDPLLGYSAKMGVNQSSSAKFDIRDGSVIYDVIYTTDKKGRRIAPYYEDTAEIAIILFGCSFTFGEGINDNETFAWFLGKALGPKFQVYNYGVKGYGSHQMLALLESDRLDELKGKYKEVYGYYLTLPSIEMRSAGHGSWNQDSPWYEFDGDSIKRMGTFGDRPNTQIQLRGKFYQSLFLHYLATFTGDNFKQSSDEMLNRDAAIIEKSSKIFTKKFENSTFTTVLYADFKGMEKKLKEKSVNILELRPYFPEEPLNNLTYGIHELDLHPNAKATKIVANALYENITSQLDKNGL